MNAPAKTIRSGSEGGCFSVLRGQAALIAGAEGSGRVAQTNGAARLRREKSRVLTSSNRAKPGRSSRNRVYRAIGKRHPKQRYTAASAARIPTVKSASLTACRTILGILDKLCPPTGHFPRVTRLTPGAAFDLSNRLPDGPRSRYLLVSIAGAKALTLKSIPQQPLQCNESHDPSIITPPSMPNIQRCILRTPRGFSNRPVNTVRELFNI